MNDLPSKFNNADHPAQLFNKEVNCLLYANALILIATSEKGLQSALNKLNEYCHIWRLSINTNKSKVIIFNKTGRVIKSNFSIGSSTLDIVSSYRYLGIEIHCRGSFKVALDNLRNKARKAMFKLLSTIHSSQARIMVQSDLYDKMVKPILLYSAEIWGAYTIDMDNYFKSSSPSAFFDKLQYELFDLSFAKRILGVHKKSCNFAVRGELARRPLSIEISGLVIKNWATITQLAPDTLLYDCFLANNELMNNAQSEPMSNHFSQTLI